jgi:tetratricopeptide (TPR) repeat protein
MNKKNASWLAGIALHLVVAGVFASGAEQAMQEANAAYLRGNYGAAARILEPFASQTEPRRMLAQLYVVLGRYADAELLYRRIPEAPGGLAGVLQLQGRYAEADTLLRRACEARVRKVGIDDPDVADCFARMGELARLQGRLEEAERRLWQAYQIQTYLHGEHGSAVGRTLTGLGRVAAARGETNRARDLFRRALAIAERPARKDWGRLDERDLLALHAAEREHSATRGYISTRTRDSEHPEFARQFDHLAELYAALGRNAEAQAMLKRSIAIREKAFGPDHPEVASSRSALKALY